MQKEKILKSKKLTKFIQNEVNILSCVNHPNIIWLLYFFEN